MKLYCSLFFLLLFALSLKAQYECLEYMQEHIEFFDYDSSLIKLPKHEQFDAFVVGERHFIQENISLHSTLIHSLNKEKGIRHVLIEFPPSMSFFIQRYYQTKEEKWLDIAFEGVPFEQYHKELYRSIKEKTPEIQVVGYDLEVGGFSRVNRIISELNGILRSPKEFTTIVNYLNSFRNDQPTLYSAITFQGLYHLVKKNRKRLKKAFGAEYVHFLKMMENLKAFFPNSEEEIYEPAFQERRDSFMFENIVQLQDALQFEQCYISVGAFHIEKIKDPKHPRLAYLLNEKSYSPFKNRVASIRLNYLAFAKDALGNELQFKQILDHSNLSKLEIESLFKSTKKKVGISFLQREGFSCSDKDYFDYYIYLRPLSAN
jgi:hypothetical protein